MINLNDIAQITLDYVDEFWINKNHPNTGEFQNSLRYEIEEGDSIKISIYGNEYGIYMNKGITPDRVPYSPGGIRGGTSLYIQGLKSWVETKLGVDPSESLGVAFAIANTHSKEGITSQGNVNTRSEGGTGWLDQMVEEKKSEITNLVFDYLKQNIKK